MYDQNNKTNNFTENNMLTEDINVMRKLNIAS